MASPTMAQLTSEQLSTVGRWAADGATLNEIQQRLKTEFGVTITYMEARLLIIDAGVKLKDKPREPEPASSPPPSDQAAPEGDESPLDPSVDDELDYREDPDAAPPAGAGRATVTVDELIIPGALVSGKATFSDGKTISWFIDQMGRLGMKAPEPGYKPPAADVPAFQKELDRVLMQQGF
jgi:hypothetical protein